MPGPAPSTSPDRQRRPSRDLPWVDLPAKGRSGRPPAAPKSVQWTDRAKTWWKEAWATPSASQWTDRGDYWTVVRRAELEDAWAITKDAKLLSEMRHLDAQLGLTAKARKELRWRIVDGDQVVEVNGESTDELAARRKRTKVAM